MFSYVDKTVRKQLETKGLLVGLDDQGNKVANDADNLYLSVLGPVPLPRMIGNQEHILSWYSFVKRVELAQVLEAAIHVNREDSEGFRLLMQSHMSVNAVLALPGFAEAESPLVRVHSCCLTGDVFGSMRCECGPQLDAAFTRIAEEGTGAIVYMHGHEGRGIGLWAKAATYLLQDDGQDTYEANRSLGLPEDSRDFTEAAVMLRYLRKEKPIRLLTNNPTKREQLEQYGQRVDRIVPHLTGVSHFNRKYMLSKKSKGHMLPEL